MRVSDLADQLGCPFEGEVDPAVVQDIVQAYAEVDADMIVICDTLGIGYPEQADVLLGNAIESGVPVETLAVPSPRRVVGWSFTPQDGNSLVSSIAAKT